jgi:hypothetical protein
MKKDSKETIVQEDRAGKTYRLICISIPGQKTGGQLNESAAKAGVKTGEHAAGADGIRQKEPDKNQLQMQDDCRQKMPDDSRPEISESNHPQVPEEQWSLILGTPAGKANCSAEQAAPDTAGGGAV